MQSDSKKGRDILKIKFKSQEKVKIKVVNCKDLDYAQFSQKIGVTFDLDKQKPYMIYYVDQEKEEINISNNDDYYIFLQTIESSILYLEETADREEDFRRQYKKEEKKAVKVQALLPLSEEVQRKLAQKEAQLIEFKAKAKEEIEKLRQQHSKQIKLQIKEIEKLNFQLQQCKEAYSNKGEQIQKLKQTNEKNQPSQMGSKQSKIYYEKMIEEKKEQMLKELSQFKTKLQQKTKETMIKKLEQIKKQLQINQKRKYQHLGGNFQHKVGCKGTFDCQYEKRIIGLRYRCIICAVDICQKCSNQDFQTKDYCHNRTHPMIQYRNDKWDNEIRVEMKETKKQEKKIQKDKKIDKEKIAQLVQILNISQKQANELVRKYPNMSLQELISKKFEA